MENKIVNISILAVYYYAEMGKSYPDTVEGRQAATNALRHLRLKKTLNPEAWQRAKERYLHAVKKELLDI